MNVYTSTATNAVICVFLFFYFIITSSIECSIYDDDTMRHTVLLTKGSLGSISQMCTLSQNGYSEAGYVLYIKLDVTCHIPHWSRRSHSRIVA